MTKRFRLTARQIRATLRRHGFELTHQKEATRSGTIRSSGKTVIVYEHKGRDLPRPTVRAIIEGSGLPEEEFE